MPTPEKGEKKGKWMSRCMSHEHMKDKYSSSKKRAEVCAAMWHDKND